MRRLWAVMLLAVLGFAVGAPCQSEPDAADERVGGLEFIDEVEVTVVNVDVFVRDGKGRPIPGLTAEDFRLLQDGVEMPISNFVEFDREVIEHQQVTAAVDEILPPPPKPDDGEETDSIDIRPVYVMLYVDNENLDPLQRNRVLRRVREFVSENMVGPVEMMVVSYERSVKVLEPFTDDPLAINAALRSLTKLSGGRTNRDNERREIHERIQEEITNMKSSQSNDDIRAVQMRFRQQITAFAEEEAMNVTFSLEALKEAMSILSGLDGRKSIVYVSSGLPMSPGIGLMHEYATAFRDTGFMGRRANTDKTRAFQSLTSAANSQEVSFYTIDASGLNPLEGYGAESRFGAADPTSSSLGTKTYQDSLQYMAQYTGGLAVVNTNDVSGGLQLIRDDLFSYYSMGYTISNSGQDRIHRIEVEIPGRSGYDLRYRRRFVEKSRATQVQDRVYSSLMIDIDDNPMAVELSRGRPAPAAGDRWTVPVELTFPLDTIALLPESGDFVGRVVLFIGARDMTGRTSETQSQEHLVRIPADRIESARTERFKIELQLLLREGQHRVGVGLLDQVTRQASYDRIVVTVP